MAASFAIFTPSSAAAAFFSAASADYSRSRLSSPLLLPPRIARTLRLRPVSSSLVSSSIPSPVLDSTSRSKTGKWEWKFNGNSVNVYFEEHEAESVANAKQILLVPTISDVSTVEEWRTVAKDIVAREGDVRCRATIVDWPGLGYSDRPSLEYNADVMQNFLEQFINAPDGPLANSGGELVIFGGGHAATIALRAAGKGSINPASIAAVAPTWAGPLPIVFGRGSDMETRYGLLRGTLRAPAVGWMMYNMLVSNEKSIKSQYESHVYANPENVTPSIVESRYALTKRKGARYVPAAFLTGQLDPVKSREEFLQLFAELEGKTAILVVSSANAPKRSKAEMEALKGAEGVTKFVEVPGALLPQEEYPLAVAEELYKFLEEQFGSKR
ncbi:uncharacterized protein LOC121988450 [Zingiber officinale]|uniref:AB hydrolase-1 domain-containing protein n=1 Tax=Zingiber officinale TaxID=94328 RepID=A0A8J5G1Q8_ZINOF|nr:uncharacterized protein LOC121988450 [Zingiber officinale]KAG6496867.1 hypothetical protein ZIOFF_044742 [Zingiber officinale]